MTPNQLTTLKAAILAETDATFVEARNNGDTGAMAAFFNVTAAPAFYVWRSNYTAEQIASAIDAGVTQMDSLTASKRETLLWWAGRGHDMRMAASQAAIDDLTGSQQTLKAALRNGAMRAVTRGERLFASGTGSTASPGSTTFEGVISPNDVVEALNA